MNIEAASVCLYCAGASAGTPLVLLGRRLFDPWKDYWACPGGKREPGEELFKTALRELREETGVSLETPTPLWEMVVETGFEGRQFRITNFGIEVPNLVSVFPSSELEGRWTPLDEALRIEPMAEGTRAVMHRLSRHVSGPSS